jgi:ABC-type sulfate transport system substrate-binding protein
MKRPRRQLLQSAFAIAAGTVLATSGTAVFAQKSVQLLRHFYRPAISQKAQAKYARQFPRLNLFTIDQAFGGWGKADKEHFADGGSFDQIYTRK